MNRALCVAFLAVAVLTFPGWSQNLSAPPWVRQGGVVNAASRLPVNLSGGALAPGTLVAIEGLRFEPGNLAVEIEAQGKVFPATIVHGTTDRILARLPEVNRAGPARLFVRSRGKRSAGSDITLTSLSYGIFTGNGKGWGLAASLDGPLATPVTLPMFRPGMRVTLSGTGLGRAPASALSVFVAGRQAQRVRRSEKDGIDRLSFDIPAETPFGCAVPVLVATRAASPGAISNAAVLRIGDDRGCASSSPWYHQPSSAGRALATVVLLHSDVILELEPGKPVPFQIDNLSATFERRKVEGEPGPVDFIPPPGACLTYAGTVDPNTLLLPSLVSPSPDSRETTLDLGPDVDAASASSQDDLDAGPELTLLGPLDTRRALRSIHKPRVYSALLGGNPPTRRIQPTPLFLTPGTYELKIPGGLDVGAASAQMVVPNSIVWHNRDSTAYLDRTRGVQLEWTLPPGYSAVVVAWNIQRRTGSAGLTICVPAAGATQFRIPPEAVANLPSTILSASDLSLGFLAVAGVPSEPGSITARGLDGSKLISASLSGRTVIVK